MIVYYSVTTTLHFHLLQNQHAVLHKQQINKLTMKTQSTSTKLLTYQLTANCDKVTGTQQSSTIQQVQM